MLNLYFVGASALLLLSARLILQYVVAFRKAAELEKTSPIPVVRSYWPGYSSILHLLESHLAPLIEALPFGWGHWYSYARVDATWVHKGRLPREELGADVYWVVGPAGRRLYVADPELIYDITHRWRDFPKDIQFYKHLRLFGDNVLTVEGADWQYHRRITAASFTESNLNLVFVETQRQLTGLIQALQTKAPEAKFDEVRGLPFDTSFITEKFSTHIIAGAGFGQYLNWQSTFQNTNASEARNVHGSKKSSMSFGEALETFADHLLPAIIFPAWFLKNVPSATLNRVGTGKAQFEILVKQTIKKIQAASQKEDAAGPAAIRKSDLLSNLVNAPPSVSGGKFSDQDIVGNVFLMSFAAQETTSSAIQIGLVLLAMNPEVQQALQTEVDTICAGKAPEELMDYKSDWPRMRNIMAFMMEVMRLHPNFSALPKHTVTTQQATYRGENFEIPAGSVILYDLVSPNYDERIWGADAAVFRPSRWLMPDGYEPAPKSINHCKDQPRMFCPPRGAWNAFSEGYRNCLGKKFAQVEFCTLFASLMRTHSLELVPAGDGSDESEVNWQRTRHVVDKEVQTKSMLITMKIKNDVPVRFVRRGEERFPPKKW